MFRISRNGRAIAEADTLEAAREIVRRRRPGRYDLDEIRANPSPGGHTSRLWGRLLRHPGGRVEDEPWPWEE